MFVVVVATCGFDQKVDIALSKVAVILCGGRGRRLGALGQRMPKTMVKVSGFPILWYTLMKLHASGFRHFILPLGYRGEQIQAYIDRDLNSLTARIDAVNTGDETSIGERLSRIRHLLPDGPFLLVNGDCLFDVNFDAFYDVHTNARALVTLSACSITSQYGLFVVEDDKIVSFSRDSTVRSFNIQDDRRSALVGYVNAGITLIENSALDSIDLAGSANFETDLFSTLAADGRMAHMPIDGYWFAIETQKDLEIANGKDTSDVRTMGARGLREALLRYQSELEMGFNLR